MGLIQGALESRGIWLEEAGAVSAVRVSAAHLACPPSPADLERRFRRMANESLDPDVADNEPLEFLGDAVLGMVVTDLLHRRDPDGPEGGKSRRRAQLVSTVNLSRHAAAIGIPELATLTRDDILTAFEVWRKLVRGEVALYNVTIPEGSNIRDIARILGDSELADPGAFVAAATSRELAARLDVPGEHHLVHLAGLLLHAGAMAGSSGRRRLRGKIRSHHSPIITKPSAGEGATSSTRGKGTQTRTRARPEAR